MYDMKTVKTFIFRI